MTHDENDRPLLARLACVEAQLAITQLPIRYALAVDQRDLDAWVDLFVPDVNMGRHGQGREVLREWISPRLAGFYRSIHQICGHRIDLGPVGASGAPETATGQVYCRAEHEVGDRWIVMGIRYDDVYRRVGDEWLFERRAERHWYKADVNERPQQVAFDSWVTIDKAPPALPHLEQAWGGFWRALDASAVTHHP